MRCRRLLPVLALSLASCGSEGADPGLGGEGGFPPSGCPAGTREQPDGSCLAAGEPATGCAVGELPGDAGCVPAGLSPGDCGGGFAHDGEVGCTAVLPIDECPPGSFAVPGDAVCRDFSDCGSEAWPAIPSGSVVLYVDASADGMGDGTKAQPHATIQAAVDAAPDGAVIAIAAGDYLEEVAVVGKSVTLWGRCASLVSVAASAVAALTFAEGSTNSAARGLALTGGGHGVVARDVAGIELSELWIHDTSGHGLHVETSAVAASVTLSRSLIEAVTGRGVYALAARALLDEVAIRDLAPNGYGMGRCIDTDQHADTDAPSRIEGRRLHIARCLEHGIMIHASSATIEESLVRDIRPMSDGRFGRGINVQTNVVDQPGELTLVASNVEGTCDAAVAFNGARGALERVVLRDVSPSQAQSGRGYGVGLGVLAYATTEVTVQRSLIERASEAALFNVGGALEVDAVVLRETRPVDSPFEESGLFAGRGLIAQSDHVTQRVGRTVLRGCRAMDNTEVGLSVAGSSLTVEDSLVQATRPIGPRFGRGLVVQPNPYDNAPAEAVVRSTTFSGNREAGVAIVGSDALFEGVLVEETAPQEGGWFGMGIDVEVDLKTGHRPVVEIRDSVARDNHSAGVSVSGAEVTMAHSLIERTRPGTAWLPYGDGVVAMVLLEPPVVSLVGCAIHDVSRAGVASFGGVVEVGGTDIDCAAMDLVADDYQGHAPLLTDLTGNSCGCGAERWPCQARSAALEAPEPPGAL